MRSKLGPMGQYLGNLIFAILTKFQVEYFNQTHRNDVSGIGKVIYTYIYAIEFILSRLIKVIIIKVQWSNIRVIQLCYFEQLKSGQYFNQIHRVDVSWIKMWFSRFTLYISLPSYSKVRVIEVNTRSDGAILGKFDICYFD